jgi:hypothetical protein
VWIIRLIYRIGIARAFRVRSCGIFLFRRRLSGHYNKRLLLRTGSTTFAKWPCSISGSVYNLAVQWLALPLNKPQYCRPGDSCKSGAFVLKIVRQLLTIELRLRARVIQNGLSAQIIGKDNAGNNRDPKQDCRNSKKLEVVEPTSQGE